MNARELEALLVEAFGADFREKTIVGPISTFGLADAFAECGLVDPHPQATWPAGYGLPQMHRASTGGRRTSAELQIAAGLRYLRGRYGPRLIG